MAKPHLINTGPILMKLPPKDSSQRAASDGGDISQVLSERYSEIERKHDLKMKNGYFLSWTKGG